MRNKIFVRLIGGYGNQLFIYAFGLALSKKTNKELIIDNISGFGNSRDEYKSVYALDGLKISEKLISKSLLKYFIANKYFWFLANKFGITCKEPSLEKYQDVSGSKKIFFEGYWQSYLYFDQYKYLLKNNLSIINSKNSNVTTHKKNILKHQDSVAIGMRFYEETPNSRKKYIIKQKSYYLKAIRKIEKKIANPKYYVFTTDIKRAKNILMNYGDLDVTYINPNKCKKEAKYDLYLMSLCNNFIISNGTFYWWAAYLGESESSCVIAPKTGFINKDITPSHWLKV